MEWLLLLFILFGHDEDNSNNEVGCGGCLSLIIVLIFLWSIIK